MTEKYYYYGTERERERETVMVREVRSVKIIHSDLNHLKEANTPK